MAKLNTLRNQSLQDIATVMLRVKHDLCPEHIQGLFQENNSSCNLTNSDFIISIYNTVKYGNRSLRYAAPLLWSKLTKCIKNAISLSAFKNKIRTSNLETFVGYDYYGLIRRIRQHFLYILCIHSRVRERTAY